MEMIDAANSKHRDSTIQRQFPQLKRTTHKMANKKSNLNVKLKWNCWKIFQVASIYI